MTANTIICPKCKSEIPLTDVVTHGIREQLEKEFAEKQQGLQDAIELREKSLAKQSKEIEQAQSSIERQVTEKLIAEKKKLQMEARDEAKQALNVEREDLRRKLDAKQVFLEHAQKAELELRNRQNEVEERAAKIDLEVARKVAGQREGISKQAAEMAAEAERLKLAEREKII